MKHHLLWGLLYAGRAALVVLTALAWLLDHVALGIDHVMMSLEEMDRPSDDDGPDDDDRPSGPAGSPKPRNLLPSMN